MKTIYFLALASPMIWYAVSVDILPIWTGIFTMVGVTGLLATQLGHLFGGDFDDGPMKQPFNEIISDWTSTLYKRELVIPKQNWNCKNCGGPNIEQVKCQYCGMVKE